MATSVNNFLAVSERVRVVVMGNSGRVHHRSSIAWTIELRRLVDHDNLLLVMLLGLRLFFLFR